MRFKERVVIISGGSAGMGKASALAFAKEGAHVVINGRNSGNLEKAAKEIRKEGGQVKTVLGDITHDEVIYDIVDQTLKQYGKIDILFNYVGGDPTATPVASFMEQDVSFLNDMIKLNLLSTMEFCRAVLDSMIKQKYGKIINTSAAAGKVGAAEMAVYSAVKGGVITFTKALALEMAQHKINVNCICPGAIETPGYDKIFTNEFKQMITNIVPLNRVGTPEEIASAVLYLASDDAAYITGQSLSIDGGMTMV